MKKNEQKTLNFQKTFSNYFSQKSYFKQFSNPVFCLNVKLMNEAIVKNFVHF